MSVEFIGSVIAKLRKDRNTTQDELANAVGVSAQAVSKWENGGVPDTALLPKIADFFKVSIDTLFGRSTTDYSDIQCVLMKKIIETERSRRFKEVFEICWNMERAMFGELAEDGSISDYENKISQNNEIYSSILNDEGFTRMGVANRLQYFLIVPEATDKDAAFFNGIEYTDLFKDLSDETVFNTLVFLDKRPCEKSFTPNLLIKNLNIDFDKASKVIGILNKYGLIHTAQIEMDDITQEVYNFSPTPSFTAMLIFARELIDKPASFSYFCGGRNKPYLA